jgi:hypothetical protein
MGVANTQNRWFWDEEIEITEGMTSIEDRDSLSIDRSIAFVTSIFRKLADRFQPKVCHTDRDQFTMIGSRGMFQFSQIAKSRNSRIND